jgi:2-methylcitrate dehydratase PrpD
VSVTDATTTLAEHAIGLDAVTLPAGVVDQARRVVADTIGVLLSASRRKAVPTALAALPPSSGPCTVVGHHGGVSAIDAAFVNGIGGHDIELDDSHSPSRTHPAATVIPAALAAAEDNPTATYGDLLAGVIAGYDVQSRISRAMGRNAQYDRGFHPSAVCGVFGAAAAAGRILDLDIDQMRCCLGLAASQSSGLLTYADDPFHMAKSFQTGVAARNGVTAARFAAVGYRAAPDVLTGKRNALGPFGGDAVDSDALTAQLGSEYAITTTSLKRHACCGLTHSSVDAMLLLLEHPQVRVDSIDHIRVELPHKAVPRIDGNVLWSHNVQYVVALAAHEGRVTLEHFTEAWTTNPDVQRLAARVTVAANAELDAAFPEHKGAIVTVSTPTGEYVQKVDAPRGSPGHPLTEGELHHKFRHLAAAVLDDETSEALWISMINGALAAPWSRSAAKLIGDPESRHLATV